MTRHLKFITGHIHCTCTHLKNGTILEASTSAVLKPCEYNIT